VAMKYHEQDSLPYPVLDSAFFVKNVQNDINVSD
jgi:hypothetical protein